MNRSPAASLTIPLFISLLSLFIFFAIAEGRVEPQSEDVLPLPLDQLPRDSRGKAAWPEVVGLTANEATKKNKGDRPDLGIEVIHPHFLVTQDYRLDRVRIFLDGFLKVAKTPIVG